jgi:hypothetical protein
MTFLQAYPVVAISYGLELAAFWLVRKTGPRRHTGRVGAAAAATRHCGGRSGVAVQVVERRDGAVARGEHCANAAVCGRDDSAARRQRRRRPAHGAAPVGDAVRLWPRLHVDSVVARTAHRGRRGASRPVGSRRLRAALVRAARAARRAALHVAARLGRHSRHAGNARAAPASSFVSRRRCVSTPSPCRACGASRSCSTASAGRAPPCAASRALSRRGCASCCGATTSPFRSTPPLTRTTPGATLARRTASAATSSRRRASSTPSSPTLRRASRSAISASRCARSPATGPTPCTCCSTCRRRCSSTLPSTSPLRQSSGRRPSPCCTRAPRACSRAAPPPRSARCWCAASSSARSPSTSAPRARRRLPSACASASTFSSSTLCARTSTRSSSAPTRSRATPRCAPS